MKETVYTIPGWPLEGSLALIADLHNRPYEQVLRSLEAHRPQLIAVAGDMIRGIRPEGDTLITLEQVHVLPFLSRCVEIAPTFFSLGNHEMLLCSLDLDLIRRTGVTLLDNTYTEFVPQGASIPGTRIVIGGLTSGYVLSYRRFRDALHTDERYPERVYTASFGQRLAGRIRGIRDAAQSLSADPPDTAWLPGFAAVPGWHILLSHHPEYFPLIPSSVELVLSGHAHGGQWDYYSFRDHRWKGVFAPGQGLFPKYTGGVYDDRLVVSRGLANTAGVPRICNPTEVVYIEGGPA